MRKQMTEQQAWEQLYGRRSPEVRVLGRYTTEEEIDEPEPERRQGPAAPAGQGDSEAHAA
jgi:hypothetical protein